MSEEYSREDAQKIIEETLAILLKWPAGENHSISYDIHDFCRVILWECFSDPSYIEAYNSLSEDAANEYFQMIGKIAEKENLKTKSKILNGRIVDRPEVIIEKQIPGNPDGFNCDIYAWNSALEAGFDPRAQDGSSWNGNRLNVPRIFEMYPDRRSSTPPEGTAGYIFHNIKDDGIPYHMEFYDYRQKGDRYIRYATPGDEAPKKEEIMKNALLPWGQGVGKNKGIFIPLNKIAE